jgi:hypothetical protein
MDEKTYQRFMAKVSISEHGCWLWTGAKTCDGYGKLAVHGRTIYAHRLAYEHWHSPIGDGLRVLHRCDVPACVNPEHLRLGTQADNVADMHAKNRHFVLRGENHGNAKLTANMVHEIRLLAAELSSYELGRQYGVSQRCVWCILQRETWQHVA